METETAVEFKTETITGFFDKTFELKTDSKTLWISHGGKCVGRFSPLGVDICIVDDKKPIFNRGKSIDLREWNMFKSFTRDCYGFTLSDDWKPDWILSNG